MALITYGNMFCREGVSEALSASSNEFSLLTQETSEQSGRGGGVLTFLTRKYIRGASNHR